MSHLLCAHYVKGEVGVSISQQMTRTAGVDPCNQPTNQPPPQGHGLTAFLAWPTFVALFGLLDAQISGNYATIMLYNHWPRQLVL